MYSHTRSITRTRSRGRTLKSLAPIAMANDSESILGWSQPKGQRKIDCAQRTRPAPRTQRRCHSLLACTSAPRGQHASSVLSTLRHPCDEIHASHPPHSHLPRAALHRVTFVAHLLRTSTTLAAPRATVRARSDDTRAATHAHTARALARRGQHATQPCYIARSRAPAQRDTACTRCTLRLDATNERAHGHVQRREPYARRVPLTLLLPYATLGVFR